LEREPAVIAVLLEVGADPNARDEDERTPLDIAEGYGRPEKIVTALEAAAGSARGPAKVIFLKFLLRN